MVVILQTNDNIMSNFMDEHIWIFIKFLMNIITEFYGHEFVISLYNCLI